MFIITLGLLLLDFKYIFDKHFTFSHYKSCIVSVFHYRDLATE